MIKNSSKHVENDFDTETTLVQTATKLRDLLESIDLHGDGEHPSTIQDIARITVALTQCCAELRQNAKARRRELAAYSLDEIRAYLHTLSDKQRRELGEELAGVSREEPLL